MHYLIYEVTFAHFKVRQILLLIFFAIMYRNGLHLAYFRKTHWRSRKKSANYSGSKSNWTSSQQSHKWCSSWIIISHSILANVIFKRKWIFVSDKDIKISNSIIQDPLMRHLSSVSTRNSCIGKLVLFFPIDIMNYIAYQIFLSPAARKIRVKLETLFATLASASI